MVSLMYALNQKKRQLNVVAKNFEMRHSTRKITERQSIRSLIDDSDDSLALGDSEMIKAIGHTRDDIRLTPKQRKMQSGVSSGLMSLPQDSKLTPANHPGTQERNHTSVNSDADPLL